MTASTAVAAARQRSRTRLARLGLGSRVAPYLLLLPFLVLFAGFLVAPLLYALGLSLFRDTMIAGRVFVGLDNYAQAFTDGAFWYGVGNMLLFGVMQIPVMLVLALAFALILHGRKVYAHALFRIGFFVPYAVPSVLAALIWGYLYGPAFGPVHQIAHMLHLAAPDFLSARWMLPSIANIVTWEFTGYNMVILYAALQAVPSEVEEAAALDGASEWQLAVFVKIPIIGGAILMTVIFSTIHTLQLFNEPQIMSSIAPAVIGDHYTPNLYAYNLAFNSQQLNYSAAISFVVGLFVALLAYGFTRATRKRRGTA